jgi:hypothetical protein
MDVTRLEHYEMSAFTHGAGGIRRLDAFQIVGSGQWNSGRFGGLL